MDSHRMQGTAEKMHATRRHATNLDPKNA